MLDYQVGVGNEDWSSDALAATTKALAAARRHELFVVFSRVAFLPDYLDVAATNKAFAPYKQNNLLPPEASRILDALSPQAGEAVVHKDRFSPYAGTTLHAVLRAQQITQVVLTGVSTGGVVLAAFVEGESTDQTMTVLSDACADPDRSLHDALMRGLFPRSAQVTTVASWQDALPPG